MAARNKVIAGDYEGKMVVNTGEGVKLGFGADSIILSGTNVINHEVMDETSKKSASSAVGRGLLGNFLLGPVGLVAGAATAKSKDTKIVAIEFNNGKKSLLELDSKMYKLLISALYTYKPANNGVFNPNIKEGKYAPIMGEKSDTAKLFGKIGKGFIIFMIIGTIFMMIEGIIK